MIASPYEVEHSAPEIRKLISCIKAIDGEVRIVMEATGAYHLPLLSVFKDSGFFVSVINSLAMKKYAHNSGSWVGSMLTTSRSVLKVSLL